MTHLLLSFVVLVLAGLGMALGVLLRGRPLPHGCGRARGEACGPCEGAAGAGGRGVAEPCAGPKEGT